MTVSWHDETTTLVCRCGARSCEHRRGDNAGEIQRRTGFGSICDVSNGLMFIWLCPACFEKVAAAWRTIVEIAGHDMISMTGVLRQNVRRTQ
jgi:hypothetical protein